MWQHKHKFDHFDPSIDLIHAPQRPAAATVTLQFESKPYPKTTTSHSHNHSRKNFFAAQKHQQQNHLQAPSQHPPTTVSTTQSSKSIPPTMFLFIPGLHNRNENQENFPAPSARPQRLRHRHPYSSSSQDSPRKSLRLSTEESISEYRFLTREDEPDSVYDISIPNPNIYPESLKLTQPPTCAYETRNSISSTSQNTITNTRSTYLNQLNLRPSYTEGVSAERTKQQQQQQQHQNNFRHFREIIPNSISSKPIASSNKEHYFHQNIPTGTSNQPSKQSQQKLSNSPILKDVATTNENTESSACTSLSAAATVPTNTESNRLKTLPEMPVDVSELQRHQYARRDPKEKHLRHCQIDEFALKAINENMQSKSSFKTNSSNAKLTGKEGVTLVQVVQQYKQLPTPSLLQTENSNTATQSRLTTDSSVIVESHAYTEVIPANRSRRASSFTLQPLQQFGKTCQLNELIRIRPTIQNVNTAIDQIPNTTRTMPLTSLSSNVVTLNQVIKEQLLKPVHMHQRRSSEAESQSTEHFGYNIDSIAASSTKTLLGTQSRIGKEQNLLIAGSATAVVSSCRTSQDRFDIRKQQQQQQQLPHLIDQDQKPFVEQNLMKDRFFCVTESTSVRTKKNRKSFQFD